MKHQKAKMKGNEGPKIQNERKRSTKPKWKEMKAQFQNERKCSLKRQILEKEKLQILKRKWQF